MPLDPQARAFLDEQPPAGDVSFDEIPVELLRTGIDAVFAGGTLEDVAEVRELGVAGAVGEKRSCLVHCSAGMSRSATLVLAYLVRHVGMSLLDALSHTKARRPLVSPLSSLLSEGRPNRFFPSPRLALLRGSSAWCGLPMRLLGTTLFR